MIKRIAEQSAAGDASGDDGDGDGGGNNTGDEDGEDEVVALARRSLSLLGKGEKATLVEA